jgi:hypothetical protein
MDELNGSRNANGDQSRAIAEGTGVDHRQLAVHLKPHLTEMTTVLETLRAESLD